ncbi:MAG TPA: trypsin-like peptidase domain-containing protein [Candidatus Hydrogenedentes bacterium]|nr:trypsin-like peptidase domain-containing protein [Candidatus Hydrogenedentota bacterium]HOL75789.1 trypsin-like peptidase domain-containing protein [Candidatus Hydrogenedentota bacterium]HPO84217.1 trypsin-like peptidase domain-containing protein [Candidatus Hydrogenedentota bacterium]
MRNKSLLKMLALAMFALFCGATYATSPILKEIEGAFIELGEKVRPTVVYIEVEREAQSELEGMPLPPGIEEFFPFFRGPQRPDRPGPQVRRMPRAVASGSGFIFDKRGHIITNNHVVADAKSITVKLWNGKTFDATVVGRDPQTDLAVIKIEPDFDLPVATLGDSSTLRVGQFAMAAGNPARLEGSLSFGHITALGRGRHDAIRLPDPVLRFMDFIQTDAAINLGNSGGPLCNIDGEVIGINIAIVWGAESIGFAIPVNTAKKVVPELIAKGKVVRGFLGVQIDDAANYADADNLPDRKGAYVVSVIPDKPAAKAGVQVYDVIKKVNGQVVENASDLTFKVAEVPPGETVTLEVWRNGKTLELKAQLEELSDEQIAQATGAQEPTRESTLGLRVQALTNDMIDALGLEQGTKGVIVSSVEPDSPAEKAGIIENDVIIEVAKQPVSSPQEFTKIIREHSEPGKAILLRVLRSPNKTPIIIPIRIPKQ